MRHLCRDGEMCPFAAAHPAACRVWWITTHQRLNTIIHPGHPPVGHAILRQFNVGMREWFEAGHCGPSHVVDVFNMTDALVMQLPEPEARALTHDTVHWSMVSRRTHTRLCLT